MIYINFRESPVFFIFIFFFIFNLSGLAQTQINIPEEIKIEVNKEEYPLSTGWIDSLVNDAVHGKIHYKIVGAKRASYYTYTQIQLPQILSFNEILRQIILYYALLHNEKVREKEILNIYPFFESIEEDPAIRASYVDEGEYEIDVERWNRIPIPSKPKIEDRYIFNQILQDSFMGVQSLGDVPDNVFEKVALKNNLSVEQTKIIYQNTVLWQIGDQIKGE